MLGEKQFIPVVAEIILPIICSSTKMSMNLAKLDSADDEETQARRRPYRGHHLAIIPMCSLHFEKSMCMLHVAPHTTSQPGGLFAKMFCMLMINASGQPSVHSASVEHVACIASV